MPDKKKLEEFIVETDDVASLMEIYASRIKSYAENRAYYTALSIQCGEFFLATRKLGDQEIARGGKYLYQIIKLLEDKNLQSDPHTMEVFIEAVHNLSVGARLCIQDSADPYGAIAQQYPVLKNIIRHLEARPARPLPPPVEKLVEDPFDEMENLSDFVEGFLDDFDSAFDSAIGSGARVSTSHSPGGLVLSKKEQGELDDLFLSISGAYIQPVKDFISELKEGSAGKEWIDMCMGAIRMIEDAGTKMSHEQVIRIVRRFKQLMLAAKKSTSPCISKEIRLQLLKEYANLTSLMPEAFATSDSHATRGTAKDSVIINTILRKTPGIGPVSRTKLIAAGLNTLDKYLMANAKDLSAVSGISEAQSNSLIRAFKEYADSVAPRGPDENPAKKHLIKLFKHIKDLKAIHGKYKQLTRESLYAPSKEDQRNQLRVERQRSMWEINILLAELQAATMAEDFRRMVYDRRLQRLDEFMQAQARDVL